MMLSKFILSHVRFTLLPKETICLPRSNKGITLRGAFGSVFRSLVCVDLKADCDPCLIRSACPYALIFSPTVPQEAERLRLNRDIPRPFVIKPPLAAREVYKPGEPLIFDLVLIGKARDFFPYFFLCFQKLGEYGIGVRRGRFHVDSVEFLDAVGGSVLAFKEGSNVIGFPDEGVAFSELVRHAGSEYAAQETLRVQFLTPVLLKVGGKWTLPHFGPLMRRLRDRIHALSYFYCGETLDMDFSGFGNAADTVRSTADRMQWVEEKRYAKHRGIEYPLQGFVGSMTYEGDMAPFLPFLILGEYVHVGKAATFGQGWLRIERCGKSEGLAEDQEAET